MNSKIKNVLLVFIFALLIYGLGATLMFAPEKDYSYSERRELKKFPEVSAKTISDGSLKEMIFRKEDNFMQLFETATQEQFPYRDSFRTLKMFSSLKVFNNLSANDLYTWEDHFVKEEKELNINVVSGNLDTIAKIYENAIKGKTSKVYYTFVPDKHYYFGAESGRLVYDSEEFLATVFEKLPFAEYIDITDTLSKDSYYHTDTHWSQDKIIPTAEKISSSLGVKLPETYTENVASDDFYGVYTKQVLLPCSPDKLTYLTNDTINSMSVKALNNQGVLKDDFIYNPWKLSSDDMYDFFMSGAQPLQIITNPNAASDKELVIFRDSFGSSMSPLLAQGYKKTTVVDLRYINSMFLGQMINFNNADVLFMYSSTVLNSPKVFLG